MSILSQFKSTNYTNHISCLLNEKAKHLVSPLNPTFSIFNYTDYIESIGAAYREFICQNLVDTFEAMDAKYKASYIRKRDFYVHQTRQRSLITVFGVIRFNRTIYKHKYTGKTYTYVDRKLGLPKYDRYDPCIKSMVVEDYANSNSMIKTGEHIGDRIYASFSTSPHREHYRISRQTVFNILKKQLPSIMDCIIPTHTPPSLYIMADEKYIHTQGTQGKAKMVKSAVVFEGIQKAGSRNVLINKTIYSGLETNFWSSIYDILSRKYDMDLLKNITILGDGAVWIKSGTQEFDHSKFGLDKFHFRQAIHHITPQEDIESILVSNVIGNDKKTFKEVINTLMNNAPTIQRQNTIREKSSYILKHWKAIQLSYHELEVGCSMESAISHNLASIYTNRPKGYQVNNLERYINIRNLHLNHIDIRKLYLETLDQNHKKEKEAKYDFSMFEPRSRYDKSSTSNWLKGFISKI